MLGIVLLLAIVATIVLVLLNMDRKENKKEIVSFEPVLGENVPSETVSEETTETEDPSEPAEKEEKTSEEDSEKKSEKEPEKESESESKEPEKEPDVVIEVPQSGEEKPQNPQLPKEYDPSLMLPVVPLDPED